MGSRVLLAVAWTAAVVAAAPAWAQPTAEPAPQQPSVQQPIAPQPSTRAPSRPPSPARPSATEGSSARGAAQAQIMLARVVRALKANPAQALAAFNSPTSGFRMGELYVVCFDMHTGAITAHTDGWLLGTKINGGGEPYGAAGAKIFAAAQPGRFTRVSFNFPRPGSTEAVPKVAYVTRVGDQGCAVGYYRNLAETTAR